MRRIAPLALLLVALFSTTARSATITFAGLTGANGDPMPNPYVESGFQVVPNTGTWDQGQMFGDPTPDIFSASSTGIINVTTTANSPFLFTSVALADAFNGTATYTLQGFLLGSPVFSTSGGPLLIQTFTNASNPSPASPIDLLRITINRNSTSSYNLDNVVVSSVPEPASLATLSILAAATLRRRR